MDEEDIQVLSNRGIAELIGTPGDVSFETQKKHFPFINKVMAFGNLNEIDIMDEKDLMAIKNIHQRSKMTRYEKQQHYNRADYTDARAYLTANISLARDGFLVKRITSSYRTISMSQEEGGAKKRGMLSGVLNRGGSNG